MRGGMIKLKIVLRLKNLRDDLLNKYFPDEYISPGMKAAVDYMLAKAKNDGITQADICKHHKVCEVTLRNNTWKVLERIKKVEGDDCDALSFIADKRMEE